MVIRGTLRSPSSSSPSQALCRAVCRALAALAAGEGSSRRPTAVPALPRPQGEPGHLATFSRLKESGCQPYSALTRHGASAPVAGVASCAPDGRVGDPVRRQVRRLACDLARRTDASLAHRLASLSKGRAPLGCLVGAHSYPRTGLACRTVAHLRTGVLARPPVIVLTPIARGVTVLV